MDERLVTPEVAARIAREVREMFEQAKLENARLMARADELQGRRVRHVEP